MNVKEKIDNYGGSTNKMQKQDWRETSIRPLTLDHISNKLFIFLLVKKQIKLIFLEKLINI